MSDQSEFVQIQRHPGGVVDIVMSRADALNAVSTAFAEAFVAAVEPLTADTSVRAVVLSSSQTKAFCVGADLKERNGFSDSQLRQQRPLARRVYRAIMDLPMPTVAAVEGYALGGGLELALACDLIVAGADAVVGLPEVSVGVIPGGGGTQLLTRRVGWGIAADLILTARRIAAAEALTLGVINRAVDSGQARATALELATTMAGHSPIAQREAKRALRSALHVDLSTGLDIEDGAWRTVAFSADRAEGVAAFAERRTPQWPGEY